MDLIYSSGSPVTDWNEMILELTVACEIITFKICDNASWDQDDRELGFLLSFIVDVLHGVPFSCNAWCNELQIGIYWQQQ